MLAFVGMVLATATLPAAASDGGRQARMLIAFPGITYAVAYDGQRLAWLETTWELRVQTRSTGRRATIRYTDSNQEFVDNWPAPPRLLVGGGRLVWISTRSVSANSYPTGHLLEASVSATRGRRLRNVGFGLDGSGDHFVGIGGGVDGKFVYGITRVFTPPSDPGSEYKVSGGEVTLLENGRKRTLPGAPPPALVARHGEHVAVSPADRDFYDPTKPGQTFIRPTPALEIRSATTGAVTSSVTATRPPRALTQSNTLTAVLTATTIEWYDAASGDRRGLVPAPKNVVDELLFAGRYLVFRDRRTVWALDTTTRRRVTVVTTKPGWRPRALATFGRSVVWAESFQKNDDARSRSDSRSVIRLRVLPG